MLQSTPGSTPTECHIIIRDSISFGNQRNFISAIYTLYRKPVSFTWDASLIYDGTRHLFLSDCQRTRKGNELNLCLTAYIAAERRNNLNQLGYRLF
jgi:hypothetical protein